jgi:SAM-dependent methyltransferase
MPVTQATRCVICESDRVLPFITTQDWLFDEQATFHLAQCADCQTVFVAPPPDATELARHYPENYPPYLKAVQDMPAGPTKMGIWHGLRRRCDDINRVISTPGKVLDVGCSTGNFLYLLQKRGWHCYGVEINPQIAEYARQRFGLPIHTGDFASAQFPEGNFDLVTLWDVLEHIYQPVETIRAIRRVLKPGGWLIFRVPNPECWEARFFKYYWAGWDTPRHLQLIPRHTLFPLLNASGFEVVKVTSSTGRFALLSISLKYVIRQQVRPKWLRASMGALAGSFISRACAVPFIALTDLLNQSSVMTVFARRKTL